MTPATDTDILISGAGLAGLIAAAGFGAQGFDVIGIDPDPPVTSEDAPDADLRSTAFLAPSVAFLERIGVWERLAPFATALQTMRIVDAGGPTPTARLTRDFDAAEIGTGPFGWNLPNWLLRREITDFLAQMPNVTMQSGVGTADVTARHDAALVTLSDGRRVRARLLVAADGRNSPVRRALGIGVRTMRYGQRALAFAVTHDFPHDNISTEVHRAGGPFTLVPLPDRDGRPCSAVIWMDDGPETIRRAALPTADFTAELNARSVGVMGHLTLVTRLTQWPIISQIADRLTAPHTALVAEAAHVLPPIGAQGLNTSLADLATLLDLSRADPGSADSLAAYHRARHAQAYVRMIGIDALNRASQANLRPLRDLRAMALGGMHGLPPLRRFLMRTGLGARDGS